MGIRGERELFTRSLRSLAKKRVLIGVGGDAAALDEDMMDVNLDRWLYGDDLPIMKLEGQLGGLSRPFEWPIRRDRKQPISGRAN
jgi:hypothetical protein